MADEINMHSLVLMHYSITLTNGIEIESSFDEEPMEVKMSQGDLTEGMELAIFGLKEGDTQTLTLTPEQGFGIRDEENIHPMPLSDFPDELKAEVGMTYMFGTPDDDDIPGTVLAIHDDLADVDFNHPLAGQELVFSVHILDVNNAHVQVYQDS
jgi:FKBP-type peptidyl-prolyl cis-trans isomerase SlpA